MTPALTLLRLRGAGAAALAASLLGVAAAVVADGKVSLPLIDTTYAAPVPAAYLLPMGMAIVYGSARRALLPELHATAAQRLWQWRALAFLLCSCFGAAIAVAAPDALRAATTRNAMFMIGVVAVSAVVLSQGLAWAPLLVAVLLMSIFGAQVGGSYEAWAVVFQPSGHAGAAAAALVAWSAGFAAEMFDLQTRVLRRFPTFRLV